MESSLDGTLMSSAPFDVDGERDLDGNDDPGLSQCDDSHRV
jgi:hypothetical protein